MSDDAITVSQLARLKPDEFAAILAGPEDRAAVWIGEAAKNGIVEAQAVYGQILLHGRGVEADAEAALVWLKHAAQADHGLAMNMVGRCYEMGWGTTVCYEVAVYWYRLSARASVDWGMYNYATALAIGRGVAMDRAEALIWFQRAAALGHAKSHNYIGSFYEDGWSVGRNLAAALHHYRMAAEGGDFRGRFNYARLLMRHGKPHDARRWLSRLETQAPPAFISKIRTEFPELAEYLTPSMQEQRWT